MYNSRVSIGSTPRKSHTFKTSLGNNTTRLDEKVLQSRKTFYVNSTVNSEDTPEWMSRGHSHYLRKQETTRNVSANPESSFAVVKYFDTYSAARRVTKFEQRTQRVSKEPRSKWELSRTTFEFTWPKIEKYNNIQQQSTKLPRFGQSPKAIQIPKFQLPKYGLKAAPLHRDKETQIKIGHPYLVNSTYVR